jgi:hypothetical protein
MEKERAIHQSKSNIKSHSHFINDILSLQSIIAKNGDGGRLSASGDGESESSSIRVDV